MDTEGGLWVWGRKLEAYYDEYYDEEAPETDPDLIPDYKNPWTPCKVAWFAKRGQRVLDISSNGSGAMVRTVDRQGKHALYGVCHPYNDYYMRSMCGSDPEKCVDKVIYKCVALDASKLHSFASGTYMTMCLYKPLEKVASIIPGRTEPSGLTHAYKDGRTWKYIAEDEYAARKGELPSLSYAIQYPFARFE